MKIYLKLEFNSNDINDMSRYKAIVESISNLSIHSETKAAQNPFEDAWKQCSWELVSFALTVLKDKDGKNEKGCYAFVHRLLTPTIQELTGPINERAISSLVGRATVICKAFGNIRLMYIATRRKDKEKRVYITPQARAALVNLLGTQWGEEYRRFLIDRQLTVPNMSDL